MPQEPRPSQPPRAPAWMADLAGAWIFYSVLPAWPGIQPRFERIARFAPVVGLVLGGLQAGLWLATAAWIPRPAAVALVMALGLIVSGGLHHDGALDTADGLAAGPRALEAMADSRVGAAAVQSAVLLLLLRTAGLLCLGDAVAMALLWAPFWGRCAPLLAMARFPYLRPGDGGTAGFHRRHWQGLARELRPALLVGAALIAPTLGQPAGLLSAGAGLLPVLLVPEWLGRRLGGHSGDSYGACVEWTETLTLLISGLAWRALAAPG